MSETQELKAYIGRCIICNEVCAISVEDEDARREFERDGMRVELLPLAEAQELWKAYGKCICHKPDALRAELTQLRAERDTWRENWNTASKELAELHDEIAEARKDSERLKIQERNCWAVIPEDEPTGGDDADIGWHVIEYHMAKPHERRIGYGKTPQEALDAAKGAGK